MAGTSYGRIHLLAAFRQLLLPRLRVTFCGFTSCIRKVGLGSTAKEPALLPLASINRSDSGARSTHTWRISSTPSPDYGSFRIPHNGDGNQPRILIDMLPACLDGLALRHVDGANEPSSFLDASWRT